MTVYHYSSHLTPPAPMVYVRVRDLSTGREIADQPAQVDSAADKTVLPASLVAALGLEAEGSANIQGFGGALVVLPTYLVAVAIQPSFAVTVRAVLGRDEAYVLLGRDVLNSYRLVHDGPRLVLELS